MNLKTNTKRIFIVEDEAIIAEEIKSTLELLGFAIAGHTMNGDKALDHFASTDADLILLDINIKGTLNGIDLAKIIREKYDIPFIFLTSFSDRDTLSQVKDLMPYGYIVKPFNEHDLKVNIELALHKYEQETQTQSFTKCSIEGKLGLTFTEREFSLLEAFKEGMTYKDAGKKLFISVNTVKTYQKRLFQLLNVNSKHELLERLHTV